MSANDKPILVICWPNAILKCRSNRWSLIN